MHFAQTTRSISADFNTAVTPCQFGGDPDCSQCGCLASMGLAALGNHKLVGPLTLGDIMWTSQAIGGYVQRAGNWLREPMGRMRRVVEWRRISRRGSDPRIC